MFWCGKGKDKRSEGVYWLCEGPALANASFMLNLRVAPLGCHRPVLWSTTVSSCSRRAALARLPGFFSRALLLPNATRPSDGFVPVPRWFPCQMEMAHSKRAMLVHLLHACECITKAFVTQPFFLWPRHRSAHRGVNRCLRLPRVALGIAEVVDVLHGTSAVRADDAIMFIAWEPVTAPTSMDEYRFLGHVGPPLVRPKSLKNRWSTLLMFRGCFAVSPNDSGNKPLWLGNSRN